MNEQQTNETPVALTATGRQGIRRELFTKHFPSYPGWVMGKWKAVSAHVKMGGFVPRVERRKLARAFAAGEWRKMRDTALVS